jgi:SAM-dependent methyltransferase
MTMIKRRERTPASKAGEPWQLQMLGHSLKKQLKLEALLEMLGDVTDEEHCLLVTCGDNNGALNWHFRDHGGTWTWADVTGEHLDEMSAFLNEPVHQVGEDSLPWADGAFDRVVCIDVLEHLAEDGPFLDELGRVLRPGGRALVTVPNGDPRLLANRIKWRVGMTPKVYGHQRAGYTVEELRAVLADAGLQPDGQGGYSGLITEMIELAINYGYVFVLSRKDKPSDSGNIAPSTAGELRTHGLAYRAYSMVYPLMKMASGLDRLSRNRAYPAVIVDAIKPAEPAGVR